MGESIESNTTRQEMAYIDKIGISSEVTRDMLKVILLQNYVDNISNRVYDEGVNVAEVRQYATLKLCEAKEVKV